MTSDLGEVVGCTVVASAGPGCVVNARAGRSRQRSLRRIISRDDKVHPARLDKKTALFLVQGHTGVLKRLLCEIHVYLESARLWSKVSFLCSCLKCALG